MKTTSLVIQTVAQLLSQIEGITDIYIKGDGKVTIRAYGELVYEFDSTDWKWNIQVDNNQLRDFLSENLSKHWLLYTDFEKIKKFDFKYEIWKQSFRVNTALTNGKILMIFRILNTDILELEKLWIDNNVLKWITSKKY